MTNLKLDRKTGVCINSGEVRVFHNGKIFYINTGNGKIFNLPKGEFQIEGNYNLCKPKKFRLKKLPLPQKYRKFIEPVFHYVENPNKASIIFQPDKVDVFVDPKIKELPTFCDVFVRFHEIGHFFYGKKNGTPKEKLRSEMLCDWFAANKMLKRGYNPSQIHFARKMTLKSCERGNFITNYMKSIKSYE